MGYYCDVYDETINNKSNKIHLKRLTHIELEFSLRKKYTFQNPKLFDIESIF